MTPNMQYACNSRLDSVKITQKQRKITKEVERKRSVSEELLSLVVLEKKFLDSLGKDVFTNPRNNDREMIQPNTIPS